MAVYLFRVTCGRAFSGQSRPMVKIIGSLLGVVPPISFSSRLSHSSPRLLLWVLLSFLAISQVSPRFLISSGLKFWLSTILTEKKFARTSWFILGLMRSSADQALQLPVLFFGLLSTAILNHCRSLYYHGYAGSCILAAYLPGAFSRPVSLYPVPSDYPHSLGT